MAPKKSVASRTPKASKTSVASKTPKASKTSVASKTPKAPKPPGKVTKARKPVAKRPRLPTIVEHVASSYPAGPSNHQQSNSPLSTLGVERDASSDRPSISTSLDHSNSKVVQKAGGSNQKQIVRNPILCFNGVYYSLEECQLILSLMALNADDDTISQIIKYQRRSPEPYDCAGLDVYLLDENLRDIKDQIMLPLLENFEAEYIKAHTACKQWMDYMTGVIWQFQDRGWEEEIVNMAPTPFRWIDLVPRRPVSDLPLLGEASPSLLLKWPAQFVT